MSEKQLMATAVKRMAEHLNKIHAASHELALLAAMVSEKELIEEMMDLCEHFHKLDHILEAAHERLIQDAIPAPNEDMMSDAEYHRAMGFTD